MVYSPMYKCPDSLRGWNIAADKRLVDNDCVTHAVLAAVALQALKGERDCSFHLLTMLYYVMAFGEACSQCVSSNLSESDFSSREYHEKRGRHEQWEHEL